MKATISHKRVSEYIHETLKNVENLGVNMKDCKLTDIFGTGLQAGIKTLYRKKAREKHCRQPNN